MCLGSVCLLSYAQENMERQEVTNLVLVSDESEGIEVLEEILSSIKSHDGFIYMNRSDGVMSPQGPTGYKEVIEIHWKSMELMMDWSKKMADEIPEEKRRAMSGIKLLFYEYK